MVLPAQGLSLFFLHLAPAQGLSLSDLAHLRLLPAQGLPAQGEVVVLVVSAATAAGAALRPISAAAKVAARVVVRFNFVFFMGSLLK